MKVIRMSQVVRVIIHTMLTGWSLRVFFWEPTTDASSGGGSVAQGGYAPFEAYGPYDMDFGECVNVTVAEGVSGLSFDAGVQIGRTYRAGNFNNAQLISYDANGDGAISTGAFDF